MRLSRSARLPFPCALLVCGSFACTVAAAETVTIYRDTWGVPHVYGTSERGAAFGHGYAQAEDRLEELLGAHLYARGRAASVLGESLLEQDLISRMARHEELARARYGDVSARGRAILEHYVAGVRAYMAEHPEEVPAWAEPPEAWHVLALYRAFVWPWPWGQARRDLRRSEAPADDGRASNQWVVGPSRSAEGAPIALIDPHLSWDPLTRFYESHVHGGELDFFGFSIIGTPIMAIGHTDVFSVAATTGGPDCADVYEERIHPDDPLRYRYDDDWRSIEVEEIEIVVRSGETRRVEKRRIERSHHGPILKREGARAWAARTAYDDEIGLYDQLLASIGARNLGEFLNALRANQMLPQNIMYADVHGNTFYVRGGRVPRRPAGHVWDRPVPGWTPDTEWEGIHELSDLVQILNPPGGFMQNCNISPGTMMRNSPLTGERYPDYIYNSPTDRSNSRGRRALQLFDGIERLTVERALEIAADTHVEGAGRWQDAFGAALAAHGDEHRDVEPAIELLRAWDGRTDVDSRGAALFRFLMREVRDDGSGVPLPRIEAGEPLDGPEQRALLRALGRAASELKRRAGRIDVAWGKLNRGRRGDRSWPVAGCRADGIGTLRSVRLSSPDEAGVSWAYGGSFATTVVVLREGAVRSWSVTPYGQSSRADSPHFTDQGERLFSTGKLKPTWYSRAELMQNLESTKTLTVPD